MKKQLFAISLFTIFALSVNLTSCDGTSSAKESLLFGKVPAIADKLNTQQEELKAKLESSSSESDAKAVFEKYEKIYAETRENAEIAAQEWSGSTLTLDDTDELTVKTPVTVQFKEFGSKSSLNPRFTLQGEIVAAKDIPLDGKNAVAFHDGTMVPHLDYAEQIGLGVKPIPSSISTNKDIPKQHPRIHLRYCVSCGGVFISFYEPLRWQLHMGKFVVNPYRSLIANKMEQQVIRGGRSPRENGLYTSPATYPGESGY